MESITFQLKTDFIPLIQLLKFTGVAESGANASELVITKQVKCNGEIELRKRYKVVKGDVVSVLSHSITVV